MLKWLMHSLLPNLQHEITSGIQYDVDIYNLTAKAIRAGDVATLGKIAVVLEMFVAEAVTEGTEIVDGKVVADVLSGKGSDPFAGSRHAAQQLLGK